MSKRSTEPRFTPDHPDLRTCVYLVVDENDNVGDIHVFDSPEEASEAASLTWCRYLTPSEREYTRVRSFMVARDDLCDDLGAFERLDDEGIVDWTAYDEALPYPGDFDSDRAEQIAEFASGVSDALYDADLTWDDVLGDFDGALALPDRVLTFCRAICEAAGKAAEFDSATPYDRFIMTNAAAEMYAVTIK